MGDTHAVDLSSSGPPETRLDAEPSGPTEALEHALGVPAADRRDAIAEVVRLWPGSITAWARLGDVSDDPVAAYAAYRVGYHRGLDLLRQSGWRGSGYVRWTHGPNQGFLRALAGLERMAGVLGESDEQERCGHFLGQLDPAWPPEELGR